MNLNKPIFHPWQCFPNSRNLFFSLSRANRGFQEFRDKDRSFIIRFPQDNTYVTLDYKSSSILGLDLVERLGLAKGDKVLVRCQRGDFEGKVWFLGSNYDVKEKEKDAAKYMDRLDAGEEINLSNVSLSAGFPCTETVSQPSPLPQVAMFVSDDESDDLLAPPKRKHSSHNKGQETSEKQSSQVVSEQSKTVGASK